MTQLEIALDTVNENGVAPFWSVLLTGSPGNKVYDSVFDPTSRVPGLWFQGTDEHEPPRQRWHFDLWLAPEMADERITAAVAVGGSVVDDSQAPSFTVLADPDGNKVCVCTCLERDRGRSTRSGGISGDWGGGYGLGRAALWGAMRAEDGRGPDTALRRGRPLRRPSRPRRRRRHSPGKDRRT
ncbi:MAG TPA: VOC family protein [Streptosporangiaceae bacterium]|nr:VOC family protein [Streptosporangiaceae bacterium]